MNKKVIKILIILSIVIVVLFIFASGFKVGKIFSYNKKEDLILLNSNMIKERIEGVSELATVKYYYSQVETLDEDNKFNNLSIPFTNKKLIIQYDGVILAGIDLSKISEDDIKVDDKDKKINISIPRAMIMSNTIEDTKTLLERDTIFNNLNSKDWEKLREVERQHAEKTAIDRGILEGANKNAISTIKRFLNVYDDTRDKYEINIIEKK